ncbi:shikimate dehydrogenase [Nitrospirillum pindoramense]|uniref:Shikimate dehydrogenase (NADP(+)) n=1 Tax=Nitrospirillum amazonense TaxID=28077 RepID=A0A560GS13_9PROT|nr:shikimate dehydrogenase [Nitrospirillum amazonense]TWB36802.1 shikimate dehydrogenase [Nitrospirillum amazonense]
MISGKAKVAGVMGWPVGHSRSPRLHGYWLAHYGIDGAYVPLAVAPDRIEQALRALPALGFAGCNVTVPHKEAAFRTVDRVDATARRMGAVNTVIVHPDGTLEGRNTDGFGFIENLKAGAPGWTAATGPAVIIGAGGAARSLVVALADAGVPEIRLVNRTLARAQELVAELGPGVTCPVTAVPWDDRADALADAHVLANATTQGMVGHPPLDLALDALPRDAVVTDIVYTPVETPLLAAAQARGHVVVDGRGMLLHQGRPGFEAWFGQAPQVTDALYTAVFGD